MRRPGSFGFLGLGWAFLCAVALITLPGDGAAQPSGTFYCVWELPPTNVEVDYFEIELTEIEANGNTKLDTLRTDETLVFNEEGEYVFPVALSYASKWDFQVRSVVGDRRSGWSGPSEKILAPDRVVDEE